MFEVLRKKQEEEKYKNLEIEAIKEKEIWKAKDENIKNFMASKKELLAQIKTMKADLEDKKQLKEEKKKEKDLEKIEATDKLKKHMLEKIQVTKTGKQISKFTEAKVISKILTLTRFVRPEERAIGLENKADRVAELPVDNGVGVSVQAN